MITVQPNGFTTVVGPSSASTNQSPKPVESDGAFGATIQNLISESSTISTPSEAVVSPLVTPSLAESKPSIAATSLVSDELKNFISWQGSQQSPIMPCTIAEVWAMQGISDPANDPTVSALAKETLAHSQARTSLDPSYTPEWTGDWQTRMAQAKIAEENRQTQFAEINARNHVVVGGGPMRG